MRHQDPPPAPEPLSNDALNERLVRKLADLCDLADWPHDPPQSNHALRFWPWGGARSGIKAVPTVRTERRQEDVSKLTYLLLQLPRLAVPLPAVDQRLPELQEICRRYGIALKVGILLPRADRGRSLVAIDLSLPLLERALSAASLNEAVVMIDATRAELEALCQQIA